jgi:hypothetical protein
MCGSAETLDVQLTTKTFRPAVVADAQEHINAKLQGTVT